MTVFKPQASQFAPTSMLDRKSVKIDFKDMRIISNKSKAKCTFDDITSAITESLQNSFPKASFVNGENADIVISLKLEQYESFARGVVWIGITKYQIRLAYDGKTIEQEIDGTHSEGNMWGTKTARSVLQKSFNKSNEILVKLLVNTVE